LKRLFHQFKCDYVTSVNSVYISREKAVGFVLKSYVKH
jgi:hypothetical protein